MKYYLKSLLFFSIFLFHFSSAFTQEIFKRYLDTIEVDFFPSGMEFIKNDLWLANEEDLIKYRFPEMEELARYKLPTGGAFISDITSDNLHTIWIGEGGGSPNGRLHKFDMLIENFVFSDWLSVWDYQIQGLDFYENKLWITNWFSAGESNLYVSNKDGVIEDFHQLGLGLFLPIARIEEVLILGNKHGLTAYHLGMQEVIDFKVFSPERWINGACDIKDGKFWFTVQGDPHLYSLGLSLDATVSVNDDNFIQEEIILFPNPSTDYIQIQSSIYLDEFEAIITDMNGRIQSTVREGLSSIHIEQLPAQDYILVIKSPEGKIKSIKFTKI